MQMDAALAKNPPAEVTWSQTSQPRSDAETEEAASCLLRVTVKDPGAGPVGKSFTAAAVELALASYPGFTMTVPPPSPTPFGIYRSVYVDLAVVAHTVVHSYGLREVVADPVAFLLLDSEPVGLPSPYPSPSS